MNITTARKPSAKTRTFCKHLAGFTGSEYTTRGKSSLSEFAEEPHLLRVGEYRGNPGSLNFFLNGEFFLSLKVIVTLDNKISPGQEPGIDGDPVLAQALSKVTGFKIDGSKERVIHVSEELIEFRVNKVPYIILKITGMRWEGIG